MTIRTSVLDKDTSRFFAATWRAQAQLREQSAGDHLLHALLLGKDPLRAFSPVTNTVKLINGQAPFGGLTHALHTILGYRGAELRKAAGRVAPDLLDDGAFARLEAAAALLQQTLNTKGGL